ncbi:MAG: D-glycero-beta-D-manno-heptose 1,7-bisphosphate 7-phosphatase [Gammaproteobacteria bacterium]
MQPRLLILDRDGVINEDSPDFIKCPEEWIPVPGSLQAIGAATQAGFHIAVVSNQSGLGRGLFAIEDLHRVHARLLHEAERHGGRIDAIFYCPHRPDDHCACRKPQPGLLLAAAARSGLALAHAVMIGDRESDVAAARAAGVLPVLVRTGHGAVTAAALEDDPDLCIYPDLAYAVDALCARVPC